MYTPCNGAVDKVRGGTTKRESRGLLFLMKKKEKIKSQKDEQKGAVSE